MGRNSGTKVFWTHMAKTSPNHTITYVCQQHREWSQDQSATLANAMTFLKPHIDAEQHGNAEQ